MVDQARIRVTFYDGFLDDEWYCLPESVQKELVSFLKELQASPTDLQVQARCSTDKKGRLAYALPDGYWLYVRIEIEPLESYSLNIDCIRIKVLEVVLPQLEMERAFFG
jgi:hypothetical protein